ncbi:dimethylsulfonioproprionate lyase family protein [Actinomycetospora flava]|uniref:Dimethylsulfonioproprionate lyase family protein n=1 Tax=Actinomycetospora flava TaxID=3129232 RepID=A0ABU8M0P7_9PSEU
MSPWEALRRRLAPVLDGLPAEPRRGEPGALPVLAHLDDALARAGEEVDAELAGLLRPLATGVAWGQTAAYVADPPDPSFLAGYAHATLAQAPDVAAGLLLLGPGVRYPPHHHPAEERYLPTATIRWVHGLDDPPAPEPAGTWIHHAPWQPHGMETDDRAALMVYVWTGAVGTSSTFCRGTRDGVPGRPGSMRHQEFLAGVATRGGFASTDDARRAADAVLATVAAHLPADDRDALAAALPKLLEQESGVDRQNDGGEPTETGLVDEVARRTGWPAERARYALTAVTGQLRAEDGDLGDRITRVLPPSLLGSGPTLPPDAASEGAQGRPQPVDADELDRTLQGELTEWSGDRSGIERTVALPSEHLDLLLERLRAVESETGRRLRILDRTPTTLTVRARTERQEVVTVDDLDLAARFDDLVATVGSAA